MSKREGLRLGAECEAFIARKRVVICDHRGEGAVIDAKDIPRFIEWLQRAHRHLAEQTLADEITAQREEAMRRQRVPRGTERE